MTEAALIEDHHVIDPVCGMTVDPHVGKPTYDYEGHI
jgi:YHS domain-containing protein